MNNTSWAAAIRISATLTLVLLTSAVTTDAPPHRPALVPAPVPPLLEERCEIRGLDLLLRCVRIQVPLDWSRPDAEQLIVSAAIVPSLSDMPAPDPLVVLAGGPGQAATDYGGLVSTVFHEVRRERDIILFDQRGTGHSSSLRCPHLSPWQYGEASVRRWARDCAASVKQPQFYSLTEVIEDLEALRRALHIDRFNLWGVSYGTLTAQQYMRRYEAHVRSAILDGAIAPQRNLLSTAGPDADAQLQALFDECAALPDCRYRYPQLRQSFTKLLTQLARRPALAAVRRPLSTQVNRVRLTRDAVALMIRDALYTGRSRAILPYAIDEAARGRWDVLLAMESEMNSGPASAMAWGATLSVLCADQSATSTATIASADFTRDSYRRFWQTACANWPHRPSPPEQRQALRSRVPVLVLSGGLDPITPPSSGAAVAAQFKTVLHAIAPDAAHNVSDIGCAPQLLQDFITTVSVTAPDASCLRQHRRPALFVGQRIL
jgi:pimeloyl-ACP methyl ester carboxylesterase